MKAQRNFSAIPAHGASKPAQGSQPWNTYPYKTTVCGHVLPYRHTNGDVVVPDTWWTPERLGWLTEALNHAALKLSYGAIGEQAIRAARAKHQAMLKREEHLNEADLHAYVMRLLDNWQWCTITAKQATPTSLAGARAIAHIACQRAPARALYRSSRDGRHWAAQKLLDAKNGAPDRTLAGIAAE